MIGVIFVTVCLGLRVVLGYPGGAPSSACVYLLPKHGYPHFEPQTSISPFELVLSSATYSPGQEMEVAIVSDVSPFNGWLLQVRRVDTDMIVGQFVSSPAGSRIVSCNGQNNSITHSNSFMFPNTTLRATWIAPQEEVGNLILVGTVLKDYSTFWGPLESNEIPFVPDAPSQDTTTTTKKTTTSSTTTISPSTSTSSPTTNSPSTTTLSPTTTTQATTTTIQTPMTTTTTTTTTQPTLSNTTTPQPTTTSSTTPPPPITSSTTTHSTTSSSTTQKVTTKLPSTTTTSSPTTSTKSPNQPMNSTTHKPVPTSTKQAPKQSTETEPSTQENSSSETVPSTATKDDSTDTSGNSSCSVTSKNILLLLSLWALCWCK